MIIALLLPIIIINHLPYTQCHLQIRNEKPLKNYPQTLIQQRHITRKLAFQLFNDRLKMLQQLTTRPAVKQLIKSRVQLNMLGSQKMRNMKWKRLQPIQ